MLDVFFPGVKNVSAAVVFFKRRMLQESRMTAMHQLILATRAENADLRGGGWPCSGDHWNMQLRIHPWLAAWGWDFMGFQKGFHAIFGGWVH